MTDPRYLVPETCLPFFPAGGPNVWLVGDGKPTTWPTLHSVAHLDLSAPPERDGIPERLDALGWALAVLGRRLGVRIGTTHDIVAMSGHDERTLWSAWSPGSVARILAADDPGWEEFDHTDRDQPRRIVAAALRNHKDPTP